MVRFHIYAVCIFALSAGFASGPGQSRQTPEARSGPAAMATLQGTVWDSSHHPIGGASVRLQAKDALILAVQTDSSGAYVFSALPEGSYILCAQKAGYDRATSSSIVLAPQEAKTLDLTLRVLDQGADKKSAQARPDFFDEPNFTVAGVTDTTSLGGHGSDAIVRNREAVARETASLSKQPDPGSTAQSWDAETEKSLREAAGSQPQDFDANYHLGKFLVESAKPQDALPYLELASRLNPRDFDNDYTLALAYTGTGDYLHARSKVRTLLTVEDRPPQEKAELHHLLGDVDEKLGDPLEAVRAYQNAAALNPSETNLFDWGAELLTHHAAEPAIEVFTKGNRLFPYSVRMLAGLGAAWYSLGSFDHAEQRFCEASDLNPDDPNPYLLMGKMQAAETAESPAILERLARFASLQPQNALANYYYAISLWKRRNSPEDVKDLDQIKSLLEKAIHLDPSLGLGYLELGIIYSEEKDFPKAISALQQALVATPRLEEAHYRLARLYRQQGEVSKAHAELKLYEQLSDERTQEIARRRHEVQRFVYELRDKPPVSQRQ